MADELLSNRAYAERIGVSEGAVRKALNSGRIQKTPNGGIDPATADRDWATKTNPARAKTKPSEPEQPQPRQDEFKAAASFQMSRAQKELYDALLKKLEYEKLSGALIPIKQVETDAFNAARFARDMLLKIPDRVGPSLLNKTNLFEVKEILRKEIVQSLIHLTDFLNGPEP